jgi:intracellular multiplication protein IcmC
MSATNVNSVIQAAHMLQSLDIIGHILQTVSILIGLCLFLAGMMQLKRFGEMRTFMSHQMTLWGPLSILFASILLLVLPFTITTSLRAFFGDGQTLPLAYTAHTSHDIDTYLPVVFTFIRLIGVGAIMRSCMLLSKSAGQGGHGQIGKSITFLFGGILCVHVLGTITLIKSIFFVS